MATYTIIKLKDMSPLHMGTGKENYDFSASHLHSDTISSALASVRIQHKGTDDILEFLDSFTISSAFPYYADQYFMPRPLGRVNITIDDCDEYISRKKLKGIKYIERGLWEDIVQGKEIHIKQEQLQDGFLLTDLTFKQPYKSIVTQRVTVPRSEGQDSEPFFFDWTFFDPKAGLYFITDAQGDLLDEITELFQLLGECGIGTDKNIGGGKFDVKTEQFTIEDISNPNSIILLSLYIPSEEELCLIDLENSHFELLQRGGYMAGSSENDFWHLRKKSIYTFGVGSILKAQEPLKGKIVDLRPTDYNDSRMHPVYRSGKPFALPINII